MYDKAQPTMPNYYYQQSCDSTSHTDGGCDKTQQTMVDPNHYYQQYGVPAQNYYQQYPTQYPQAGSQLQSWFDYQNHSYVKGAVVGAVATLVLTNPTVKKAIVKGVVGLWSTLQGGVEEFKEQVRDVQAEQGEE